MKTHIFASLCLVALTSVTSAREFIDLQGRKLDAELISVAGGQASLKRNPDGRVFTVAVASFSEADQKFMNTFAATNVSYSFDVASTKKKIDSATSRRVGVVETTERWSYTVQMRNKQPTELQNLRIDYWLFRKEDEGRGKGNARVAASGTHKVESMKGATTYTFETLPMNLNKSKLEGNFIYYDGTRPRSADVMAGMVIRVFDPANREVFKYATDEELYAAAVGRPRGDASNAKAGAPK